MSGTGIVEEVIPVRGRELSPQARDKLGWKTPLLAGLGGLPGEGEFEKKKNQPRIITSIHDLIWSSGLA